MIRSVGGVGTDFPLSSKVDIPPPTPGPAHRAHGRGGRGGADRIGVVVLGMHRSGTSALARVLSLLGCALPRHLLGANQTQEAGHWESEAVRAFNDQILATAGSRWCDWLPLYDGWYRSPAYADHVARGRAILRDEFGAERLFVLKDPRICRMYPFWKDILAGEGARAAIVMPVRNPLEVADSLNKRDGLDPALGMLLWLRHVLDAERATRGEPRMVCSYGALLENWAGVAARIEGGLGLAWARDPVAVAGEVEQFLSHDLRHNMHRPEAVMANPLLSGWIRQTYAILMRWDKEGEAEGDHAALDRIRTAFDEAGPAFARPLQAARDEQRRAEDLIRQWAENRNFLEGRIAELQYDLAQAGDHAALEQECAGLRAELEQARAARADETARLQEALGEVARARAEAEAAQMAVEALQEWGMELEACVDQGASVADLTAAEQRISVETDRADAALARLAQAEQDAARLERRVGDLEHALTQQQESKAQVWAELSALRQALAERDEALEAARAQLGRLAEDLQASEGWVFRLAGERQAGEMALRRMQSRLAQREKACLDAERQLARALAAPRPPAEPGPGVEDRQDLSERMADLRRQLRATEASRADDNARIDHLQGELAIVTSLLREAEGRSASLEQRALAAEQQAREAGQHAQAADAARADLEQQLAERFGEIAAMTGVLSAMEADARTGSNQATWLREASSVLWQRPGWSAIMPAAWHYRRELRLLKRRGLFDPDAYRARYADVAQSGIDPLRHYILHGLAEGRQA